jgi:hypothetical protein
MNKFDTSYGLSEKEVGVIKYNIKRKLLLHVSVLPDNVEIKLFFEGRYAWTFHRGLREQPASAPPVCLYVEVTVKLKK